MFCKTKGSHLPIAMVTLFVIGFLTARRMVPNVHDSLRVLVVNKHGRFGQLKKCRVPPLFSMKVLLIEEKIKKLYLKNSQKRAQVSQSWPKKGEKGYFKSERRKVSSAARHHEKRDHCDR